MKTASLILGTFSLLGAAPLAAQTTKDDHSSHGAHGTHQQSQAAATSETEKRVVIRRVHKGENSNPDMVMDEVVQSVPAAKCDGKIPETLLDAEQKVADGQIRKFRVIICAEQAMTPAQKIEALEKIKAERAAQPAEGMDDEGAAAFSAAVDARIAELKQPGG